MAITAAHGAFQNFVMEGRIKCRLDLAVATQAKLRVVHLQHSDACEARLFRIRSGHLDIRAGKISPTRIGVRRMTIGTANIVAPVLAASEIVVFFSTRVAGETGLGSFLRRFIFERNHLRRIAFFDVDPAWPVARFATSYLAFPTADRGKFGVGRVRVSFEQILVAVLAGFAADIVSRAVGCWFGLARLNGL